MTHLKTASDTSRPNMSSVACVCLIIGTLSGCTPAAQHPTPPVDELQIGLQLRQRGDHLNAGYWLEAALSTHPEKEEYLLRLIVEEQILSGRLLAAHSGLERLRAICGDSSAILQLMTAIESGTHYTAMNTATNPTEVLP